MRSNKIHAPVATFLVSILAVSIMTGIARSDGSGREVALRLYAGEPAGPIGLIPGTAFVNGRLTRGERPIWPGDLLQVPAGQSVSVSFDSLGQATLAGGSLARFAVAPGKGDGESGRRTLIASLISGVLALRLDPQAGAYVQSQGTGFAASAGARFRVAVRDGSAILTTTSGLVRSEQQPAQRRYILRPVGSGSSLSVRARSTRQIQIQVTDENDKPVPDLPILFAVTAGARNLGGFGGPAGSPTTTLSVTTNQQGIATTSFTAADATGSGEISARVEGTDSSYTWQLTVNPATGFWSARNTALVSAAAGAGVAIGIYLGTRGSTPGQVRGVPPTKVIP